MKEILLELAGKVDPREVIYFLTILGLFTIIALQELNYRRKDKIYNQITDNLRTELVKHGNALTELTSVVSFLAFNSRKSDGQKSKKAEAA